MQPTSVRRRELVGRERELATLEQLLETARNGGSGTLFVHGEPGIGKSALLEWLISSASEFRIVRAVGVEREVDLPYASLHQLCRPMIDTIDALPPPQRQAVQVAFGLSSGDAPGRYLVGLAVLNLLSTEAAKQPLLCVVDDAQWLDTETTQALAFVARRLGADTVALVIASRQHSEDLDHLPALHVGGLAIADARALLDSVVVGRLDGPVRERFLVETHGNPLALLELPHTLSPAEAATGILHQRGDSLSSRIEASFQQRLDPLPDQTRRLLLLAALEPLGDSLLLHQAASSLGIEFEAADPAVEAGLLEINERWTFRHPLVRSAIYRSATQHDRRVAHHALAEATDRRQDPDRKAWHRANATAAPDEDIAVELERSAGRAQARGGVAAAAAFLQRAFALTQDPTRRGDRALAAARASFQAGSFDTALGLLAAAEAGSLDELQLARIDLLRAHLAMASSRGTEGAPLLLAAAQRLEPLDVSLARETYREAIQAALFVARLNDSVGVRDVARAAHAARRRSDDKPTVGDLLLDALVALAEDYDTAVPVCREALQKLSSDMLLPEQSLQRFVAGCVVAFEVWDDESAYLLSQHAVHIAREMGRLGELAPLLRIRSQVLVFCGEFSAAASTVAETASVEDIIGASGAPYGALTLEAWRGRPRETRELIETTTREAGSRGEGIGVATSEYARAVLCNGLGQYEEALVAARSASEHQEAVLENWGLSELIEPATRTGQTKLANDALKRLAKKARAAGTDWALGIEARSRALLSEGGRAERGFRDAIEHLGRTRVRAELARTHLLYGEWLRRENRRVDAREQLRKAHEMFTEMGILGFADRAQQELAATGETARKRTDNTRADLTAQEAQIARLALDGLTNPQIGAQLFLSPRTVEWHLRHVYPKLGINTRRELHTVADSI